MKINKLMIFPWKNLPQVLHFRDYIIIFHKRDLFLSVRYGVSRCPAFVALSASFTRWPLETGSDDGAARMKLGPGSYFFNFLIHLKFFFLVLNI